jgi:hypothetical protein
MSYTESIIIPKKTFEEQYLKIKNNIKEDKALIKHRKNLQISQTREIPEKLKTIGIIENVPYEYQPFAENIIKTINKNRDHISWNDDYQLILNKQKIPGTDVIKLFQYISNSLIITKEKDLPKAADKFVNELLNLKIPNDWIKIKIKKSKRKQRGTGWIHF